MVKCASCHKFMLLKKKQYIYPANNKKLEISEEQVVCEQCFPKFESDDLSWNWEECALLYVKGEYDKSLDILESVPNKINSKTYWYHRGLNLREKAIRKAGEKHFLNLVAAIGDKEVRKLVMESTRCFEKAILIDTHYTKAWFYRGRNLMDIKDHISSIKCFENVITLDSDNKQNRKVAAMLFIGSNYFNLREMEKATQYLEGTYNAAKGTINGVESFRDFMTVLQTPSGFDRLVDTIAKIPLLKINESGKRH